jgi:hypothetical protein
MPKTWHKMNPTIPDGAVYVGRPSKWGNPYLIGEHGDRDEVIRRFEEHLLRTPDLMAALGEGTSSVGALRSRVMLMSS